MKSSQRLESEFVEFIPNQVEDGKLYVSMRYSTVVHNCCCGCGNKVVTPLTPTDWKLTYDGEAISISPSIGNWSFPCHSHYWIRRGMIEWSGQWTKEEIAAGRHRDRKVKKKKYLESTPTIAANQQVVEAAVQTSITQTGWWWRLKQRLLTLFKG